MKVQHDREADAIYIELSEASPHHGIDVPGVDGVSVDVDAEGKVVGIELLGVSDKVGPEGLRELGFEDLVSEWSQSVELPDFAAKAKKSRSVS